MMEYATFERFEIAMSREEALSASHQGRCDDDVAALLREPHIAAQLDAIGSEPIRTELRRYGTWDAAQLADDEENRARIVWLAAGDIREELAR